MPSPQDAQFLTDVMRSSYFAGFEGNTTLLIQKLSASDRQIMDVLHFLVNRGYMKWIGSGLTKMTDLGMREAERLGQVDAATMTLRQKAVQAWKAEVEAQRGGSDKALIFWAGEIQRDEDLRNVFTALKSALL